MTATVIWWAPGRQDVTWTLVMKLSSATRSSLCAGHPKLTRASLLTWIPGTTTGRLLAIDATPSCMASAPSSPRLVKLTWRARNFPSELNAPLTAELAPAKAMAVWLASDQVQAAEYAMQVPLSPLSFGPSLFFMTRKQSAV